MKKIIYMTVKKKLNNLFWVNNHEEIPYTILYLGWFGTFKIKILYYDPWFLMTLPILI